MKHKLAWQRGDTLVEVLIAIAVVSLILGGAYVTTSRSLQATRAAQERSTALKLAESQIEQIKGLVNTNPTAVFGAPSPFCIAAATGLPVDASEDDCGVDESGAINSVEPVYHLSVERAGNDFTLTATWFNVSGRQTDSLQLRYRAYE
jgi:prepilin-type N-terminal cleavage/methylation domain-containing protein